MAHSLQPLHTFALSSQCQNFVEITDLAQLKSQCFKVPFCLLGEGSNTIFLNDYAGTVIKMATQGITITERSHDFLVSVAGGENWHQLVTYLLEQGVAGFENLALIPGTVGAAPVQNIGAYGVEIAQFIEAVDYFAIDSGSFKSLTNQQCQFAYRESVFKHALKNKAVITQVHFKLPKKWQPVLSYGPLQQLKNPTPQQVCAQVIQTRNSKLPNPYKLANAGSFFKNPIINNSDLAQLIAKYPEVPHYPHGAGHHKVAAGWLIEQAGLKGYKIAGIEVHQQQALVLVNHGNSTGDDLINMIAHIQDIVLTRYNISLEHEVRLIDQYNECHISLEQSA